MKLVNNYLKTVLIIGLTIMMFSCNSDDPQDEAYHDPEKITVKIDGVLVDYSNDIIAKEYPLPATSGFDYLYKISSRDSSNNLLELIMGYYNSRPFVISVPSNEQITGALSYKIKLPNIMIDDSNINNSLDYNYFEFGTNVGDKIEFGIDGHFYKVGNTSHTNIEVRVLAYAD